MSREERNRFSLVFRDFNFPNQNKKRIKYRFRLEGKWYITFDNNRKVAGMSFIRDKHSCKIYHNSTVNG
jgi:hypothetical protein